MSKKQNYTQLTINYNKFKQLSYTSHVKMQPSGIVVEKLGKDNVEGKNSSNMKERGSKIISICKEKPLKRL